MATWLTDKEFYKEACRYADVTSIATAQKWWDAFYEVIVRELYFNGTCRLPSIGTFGLREMKETYQTHTNATTGRRVTYKVPERVMPFFTPNDIFIDDVNMTAVTKAARSRLKKGAITEKDYIRQLRSEDINQRGFVTEDHKRQTENEFKKILKEKKRKVKGKVEHEEEE